MKNYLKLAKLMFTADKKLLTKCLVIVVFFLVMELFLPVYMQWMITQVELTQNIKDFILFIALFTVAYLVLCFIAAIKSETYDYLGKHILWKTREKIYNVLWHSDYSKFIKNNKEKFKYILIHQTYVAYTITTIYTIGIIINLLTLVLFLFVAFFINQIITCILLVSILATLLLSFCWGKKILSNYETVNNLQEEDSTINNENINMIEIVRTNGLMDYYLKKNKASLDSFMKNSAHSNKILIFWETLEKGTHYIIYVLIAGALILSPNYSGAKLVTMLFITNYLLEISQQFQHQLQVVIKNIPVFDKVMNAVETPIETGVDVEKIHSIVFDSVSLQYDNQRNVFNHLSFEINKGDNVLIQGENGTGKSSILKMIVGLILPTEGTIKINQKNLVEYNKQHLYKEICYISQDELLLNESVEDYLRIISHSEKSTNFIIELRKKLKLNDEIVNISDNGKNLSGGERKKLLMMKTLLNSHVSVIVLDEIDAGLDSETKIIMKELEKELLDDINKIVIKISHIDADKDGFNKIIQLT